MREMEAMKAQKRPDGRCGRTGVYVPVGVSWAFGKSSVSGKFDFRLMMVFEFERFVLYVVLCLKLVMRH